MKRCHEVNEFSNQGWVAQDVRQSCIRMDGHSGKHQNHRWEWEGHGGTPIPRGEYREEGKVWMKRDKWKCDSCWKNGSIDYEEHAGVYEVVNLIRDSHAAVSPDCKTGISLVRVEADNAG